MTALGGSSLLTSSIYLITKLVCIHLIIISLHICRNMNLICIDKFSRIASVGSSYAVGCVGYLTVLPSSLRNTLTNILDFTL
jgi:hypothetical protein